MEGPHLDPLEWEPWVPRMQVQTGFSIPMEAMAPVESMGHGLAETMGTPVPVEATATAKNCDATAPVEARGHDLFKP